jgi:hypothetical protein
MTPWWRLRLHLAMLLLLHMSAVVGDPLNYIGQTYGILCMFEGLSINTSPHGGAVFCNLLKSENISFVPLEIALTQLLN